MAMRCSTSITLSLVLIGLVVTATILDAQDIRLTGKIAFASSRTGNFDIYIMDADGSHVERITKNPDYERSPSWSPDGSQLVFDRQSGGGGAGIYMTSIQDRETHQILQGRSIFPRWSPDGSRIALVQYQLLPIELWLCVVDTNGANLTRLTRLNDNNHIPHAWSSDGRKLAYRSRLRDPHSLYVLDLESEHDVLVPVVAPWTGDLRVMDVDWSPLGDKLAIASDGEQRGIWVMKSDGSGLYRLTEQDDQTPRWSPDGRQLVFVRYHKTYSDICVVDVTTERVRVLTAEKKWHDVDPSWYGAAAEVGSQGKVATTWASLK